MVDLFLDRVLVKNNWDQDQLNTEREITGILENRILMLFFASAECEKCQDFLPVLNDFFKRLKDPAYIEYPKLLALIYVRSLSLSLWVSLSLWFTHVIAYTHFPAVLFHIHEISIFSIFHLLSPAWTNQRSSRTESSKSWANWFCLWPSRTHTGSKWAKRSFCWCSCRVQLSMR